MASTSLITDLDNLNNNKQKNSQNLRNSQKGKASLTDFICFSEQNQTKTAATMASSLIQSNFNLPSLDRKFAHKKVLSSKSQTNMKEALKDWLIGKQDIAIEDFIKQGSSGIFLATPGLPANSKTLLNTSQSSGDTKHKEHNASSQLDGLLRNMTTSINISDSNKINTSNNNIFSKNFEGNFSNSDQPKRRIIATNRVQTLPDTFAEITDSHSTLDSSVQHSINSSLASNTKLSAARNNLPSSNLIFNSSQNIEIISLQEIRESGRKAARKLFKKTSLENINDQELSADNNLQNKQIQQQQQLQQGSALQSSFSKNNKNIEIHHQKPQNAILEPKPSQFNQIPITSSIQLTTSQLNENSDILTPQSQSSSISQQIPQSQPSKQLNPQQKLISSSFGQLKQITLSAHPFSQVSFTSFTEAQQDYSNNIKMRDSFYKQQSLTNLHAATPQPRRSIMGSTGNRIVLDACNYRKMARGILKSKSSLSINKKSVNFNERVVQYDI